MGAYPGIDLTWEVSPLGWGLPRAYLGALAAQPHPQFGLPCGLEWRLGIAVGHRGVRGPREVLRAFTWPPTHLDNALMHACLPLVTLGLGLGCSHMVPLHSLL